MTYRWFILLELSLFIMAFSSFGVEFEALKVERSVLSVRQLKECKRFEDKGLITQKTSEGIVYIELEVPDELAHPTGEGLVKYVQGIENFLINMPTKDKRTYDNYIKCLVRISLTAKETDCKKKEADDFNTLEDYTKFYLIFLIKEEPQNKRESAATD